MPSTGFVTIPEKNRNFQYYYPTGESDPNLKDILAPFNRPVEGSESFQRGLDISKPYEGISPETQKILNIIKQNQMRSQQEGIAAAKSNAIRRGITGSSTEQFGISQAVKSASESGQNAETNVLLENLRRQQALKDLQAQALFGRSAAEASIGESRSSNIANLTSDELASLRNLRESASARELQRYLGERGISIQAETAQLQRQSQKEANNPLNLILGGIGGGIGIGVGSPF